MTHDAVSMLFSSGRVSSGRGDVGFVLLVLQASAGVLGALGLAVLMGSPLHAVPALIGPVAQVVLAAHVARGKRWAWAVVIAMETVFVYAVAAGGLLGLIPQLQVTPTLTGLLMRLALPVALILLGVLEFAAPRRRVGPAT
jgi:hypothetical protein